MGQNFTRELKPRRKEFESRSGGAAQSREKSSDHLSYLMGKGVLTGPWQKQEKSAGESREETRVTFGRRGGKNCHTTNPASTAGKALQKGRIEKSRAGLLEKREFDGVERRRRATRVMPFALNDW